MKRKRRALHELVKRQCGSFHRCCVCLRDIVHGEQYYDGGWPRRAHVECAEGARDGKLREHTRAELDAIDEAELAAADERGKRRRAAGEQIAAVPCQSRAWGEDYS